MRDRELLTLDEHSVIHDANLQRAELMKRANIQFDQLGGYLRPKLGGRRGPEKSCASSKVATAGGAIGGRAGTGGHYQLESDGLSCDWLTFGHQPHPQRLGLYTSGIRQRLL